MVKTDMHTLAFSILDARLAVCRLPANHPLPDWAWDGPFCSITRTNEELSVVCAEAVVPPGCDQDKLRVERGWRVFKVAGPLDFALTGVLAQIAAVLAQAEISIFAISTFDTDYILVRAERLAAATDALSRAGWQVL